MISVGSSALISMQIAQRHGLFAATEGQVLDMNLFDTFTDVETRWKAWSKVESVKRSVHRTILLWTWLIV